MQSIKNSIGNWVVMGEAQNVALKAVNQVRAILHFYDVQGNIVGLKQGLTTPSNLKSMQTTIINLHEKPSELTGIPKFYRVSFAFLG
jgi:hypothetical protein